MVVKGEEGTGKSALLIDQAQERPEKQLRVFYSMNAYPTANSALSFLQFLAGVLTKLDGQSEVMQVLEISTVTDLLSKITKFCSNLEAQTGSKVILFLDGIDKIDSQSTTDIPLGYLPKSVPLIQVIAVRSNDKFHLPTITEGEGIEVIELPPFKADQSMQAVTSALNIRGKNLNESCLKIIEACSQIGNFLFLKVLLEQLFVHGNFVSLEDKVKELCSADRYCRQKMRVARLLAWTVRQ